MIETYCDRFSSDKSERINDYCFVHFFDSKGNDIAVERLEFSYEEWPDNTIENVECTEPSGMVKEIDSEYEYFVREQIQNETGKIILGEITFVKQ